MGLAGAALPWALADAAWRSRAAVSSFLSFACSSAVIAGFSRFGGRSSTGKYFCCGVGASARASINDELELAQPPSERLDNSTALTASAVTCPLTYANAHACVFCEHCGPIMTIESLNRSAG